MRQAAPQHELAEFNLGAAILHNAHMRILADVPPVPRLRRVGWLLQALVANLLILAAVVLCALPLMIILAAVLFGKAPDRIDWQLLLALGGGAACLLAGIWLKRGRRRLVLFLRRFGLDSSSRALSYAVSTAVGTRFRLVTLDDHELAAKGTPARTRWLVRLVSWSALAILVLGFGYALHWIWGDGADTLLRGLFENTISASADRGNNPVGAFIGALVASLMLGIIVLTFALAAILLPLAIVASTSVLAWSAAWSVRRAERAKQLVIDNEAAIEKAVAGTARRARRVFAPRLIVVRCADLLWRMVVREFVAACDLVLVDVSQPSANVVWEVEAVRADRAAVVFVGEHDAVKRLAHGNIPDDADADNARALMTLLEGRGVLTYCASDRKSLRSFARSLGARLEQMGRSGRQIA